MKAKVPLIRRKQIYYTQPQNVSHRVRVLTNPPKPFPVSEPQVKNPWSQPPPVLDKVTEAQSRVLPGAGSHSMAPASQPRLCLFQGPLTN